MTNKLMSQKTYFKKYEANITESQKRGQLPKILPRELRMDPMLRASGSASAPGLLGLLWLAPLPLAQPRSHD